MELLIFIGHSSDAKKEVECICALESDFQRFVRRHVKKLDSPISSIKIFAWENDANLGVGGQKFAVTPFLKNADIALFVFKEKVGAVTWEELEFCRQNSITTIAIFPATHPIPEKLDNEEEISKWMNLIVKRKLLTDDWSLENSISVTPIDPYHNLDDLKSIVRERILDLLPDVIFKHISNVSKNREKDEVFSKTNKRQQYLNLEESSTTLEYSPTYVASYRLKLRKEFAIKYPQILSDLDFLRNAGFVKRDKLTLTGILLFTEHPAEYLSNALIRVTKYEGNSKSSDRVRLDIDDSVINQILLARKFIEDNIESRDTISVNSSTSERIFKYPMKCIREVLANAICHRDFSDNSRFVYITIFSDRIEIANPGEWGNRVLAEAEPVSLSNILGGPAQRNLSLTKAVSAINFMEMEGSGIETAINNCVEEGAPIPEVIYESGYIRVKILPRTGWETYQSVGRFLESDTESILLLDVKNTGESVKLNINNTKQWANSIGLINFHLKKSIQDLYIDLKFWITPLKYKMSSKQTAYIELGDLLKQKEHCVIMGGPGTGKTTSLKMLANRALTKSSIIDSNYETPVLIRLREINKIIYRDIYSYLSVKVGLVFKINDQELNLTSNVQYGTNIKLQIRKEVISFLEENNSLILFDGMDEISDGDLRDHFLLELSELGGNLKNSKIFLTVRSGMFFNNLENFAVYEMGHLSEMQVSEMSNKWLGTEAKSFLKELRNYTFDKIPRTPLLLAHLLTLYESSNALPEKPSDLSRALIELMLSGWDKQRNVIRRSAFSNFSLTNKFSFLAALAFHLSSEIKKVVFSKQDLRFVCDKIFETFDLPVVEIDDLISDLETTSGILVHSGINYFEFAHVSIQEFLCGEYLTRYPNTWHLTYLNLPNELAIAVAISIQPSSYFINLTRHLLNEQKLSSRFLINFLNRLLIEKPDFEISTELGLSFKALLNSAVSLDENVGKRLLHNDELTGLFISTKCLDKIKTMYEVTPHHGLDISAAAKFVKFLDHESEYGLLFKMNGLVKPDILNDWPDFIVLKIN